jgi:hypothetical protein
MTTIIITIISFYRNDVQSITFRAIQQTYLPLMRSFFQLFRIMGHSWGWGLPLLIPFIPRFGHVIVLGRRSCRILELPDFFRVGCLQLPHVLN